MWEVCIINILLTSLQNLGFTSYEAKVYVALVKNESATVSTLHVDSGLPNSAIYGTLKKLEKRGIIEFQNTKPMRYRCIPPEDAIARLKRDHAEECDVVHDQLDEIYGEASANEVEEVVWTINGVRNVTEKVIQMLEGAQKEILILSSSTPFRSIAQKYGNLKKEYATIFGIFNRKTNDDGVYLKVISSSEEEAIKMANMVPLASIRVNSREQWPMELKSFIIVVDDSEMLVDIIKEDDGEMDLTAVWTNGKEFSSTISHLLNAKWETSEKFSSS